MSCKYELCKDWSWDGCGWGGVHNFSGSIDGIVWSCGGGCCNGVTSYSTHGDKEACENTQLIAYEKPGYTGHSQPMRGYKQRINRIAKPGCGEDWWASIKETKIPKTMSGKLPRQDTDTECPGATHTYKKVAGKKNACFYSDSDASAIQRVYDQKTGNTNMAILYSNLKEDFCAISENVFENPGGGTCLEQNAAKDLAKEYCSVGNRITGEGDGASCTRDNLDNYYSELAEAYCKGAGKGYPWCSCYNVTQGVCDTDSAAAGCDKKKRGFDKLVEGTPSEFKTQWNGMEGCFEGVCQGAVYKPENANQNCDRSVQICVQDFDFNSISGGSTINATCNQTTNSGSPPSVGDGSSYTPSGAPSGTTYPSGSISEKLDTSFRSKLPEFIRPYVPVSVDEVKSDSTKQLGVGGVTASIVIFCLVIIVLLVAGSGGGGGRGPSRFRR
jgi:hypothetical protein